MSKWKKKQIARHTTFIKFNHLYNEKSLGALKTPKIGY